MKSVAAFGEIMLRLSPPERERFFQSPRFRTYFGGGEANVVASLAQFGHRARFVTVLPPDEIASAAIRELRMLGVDTSAVVRREGRASLLLNSVTIFSPSILPLVQLRRSTLDAVWTGRSATRR